MHKNAGFTPLLYLIVLSPGVLSLGQEAAAAPAQTLVTDPRTLTDHLLALLSSLGLVLLCILATAWLLRKVLRATPVAGQGLMRILASLNVGPRERIVLFQVGETQVLVGITPGRIQTLHVLEHPLTLPPTSAAGNLADLPFSAQIDSLLKRWRA